MARIFALVLAAVLSTAAVPALAANEAQSTATATTTAPVATKLGCVDSSAPATSETTAVSVRPVSTGPTDAPKVIFQLSTADDATTILRFVTNYLAVEPTARVAVVGYADGIDFMLRDAKDANGKPYADQMATLAERGVEFKVCNNTLRARRLTAEAVGAPAVVVPGAVNEIIRLQTKEGYAYFRN
jgi:intracellular sulfur oxidation DsrE/DsrF family protein